jgi:hypothetical protein
VFTARYALSPYIKQIPFVFKGLNHCTDYVIPTALKECKIVKVNVTQEHAKEGVEGREEV